MTSSCNRVIALHSKNKCLLQTCSCVKKWRIINTSVCLQNATCFQGSAAVFDITSVKSSGVILKDKGKHYPHPTTKQQPCIHFLGSPVGAGNDDVIKWKYFPRCWLFVRGPPVTDGFPSQRPVTRSFDVFFNLRLNKRFSKESRRPWFETSSPSLWHHCNAMAFPMYLANAVFFL